MAEDRSRTDPYKGTIRPGRGRAPGTSRAIGNPVYRTNPATGNLEITPAFETGAPQRAAPTRSPLNDVYAYDIPRPNVPSVGAQIAQTAGTIAAAEGLKTGARAAGKAIGDAGKNLYTGYQIGAGTAGKPITAPGFSGDALREEALGNAKYVSDADLANMGYGESPVYASQAADDAAFGAGAAGEGGTAGDVFATQVADDAAFGAGATEAGTEGAGAALGSAGSVAALPAGAIMAAQPTNMMGGTARAVDEGVDALTGGNLGSDVTNALDTVASVGGGGCYITEAVMASQMPNMGTDMATSAPDQEPMGDMDAPAQQFDDNAPELQTLRWFRDNVLAQTPEGQQLVAEYEEAAPAIVAAVQSRPDAQQIFQGIMTKYIQPAVEAVRAGQYDQALQIYAAMSTEVAEFGIEVTDDPAIEQALEEFAQEAAEVTHDGEMAQVATQMDSPMMHPGMEQEDQNKPAGSPLGRLYVGA